jgi:hypothetical protein
MSGRWFFSLPLILVIVVPGQWFVWQADIRTTPGRGRRR